MPVFMMNSAPEVRAKFDAPDFVENNEEMLKEEFSNYFQVNIKDVIVCRPPVGKPCKKKSFLAGHLKGGVPL